jgi:hypothetical protein
MTLDELIAALQKLRKDKRHGAMWVVLTPMGGMCNAEVAVEGASVGIDWHMNKVVLHTDRQLEVYKPSSQRREELDKEARRRRGMP